jgi:hypothetical protein
MAQAAPEEPAEPCHLDGITFTAFLRGVVNRDPVAEDIAQQHDAVSPELAGEQCLDVLQFVSGGERLIDARFGASHSLGASRLSARHGRASDQRGGVMLGAA